MKIVSSISNALVLPISKSERATRSMLRMLMRLDNFCYTSISRFSLVAEGGIHPKHRLMNYHAFFVDNIDPDEVILDIGCGNGYLTYDVAKKAKHVTAIDVSKDNIELAKRDFGKENIKYVCGDASQYDFGETFDTVVLSNVLEHLDNRNALLVRIRELASKFLIRVPMINRDWLTYYKKELGVEYRLDLSHVIEYTVEGLREELEKAGMRIETASVQFGEIWAVARRLI